MWMWNFCKNLELDVENCEIDTMPDNCNHLFNEDDQILHGVESRSDEFLNRKSKCNYVERDRLVKIEVRKEGCREGTLYIA